MTRLYVVTGAASGIGKATASLLKAAGHDVIGADLRGTDISADLSNPEGRAQLVEAVQARSGGTIDGLLCIAGTSNDTLTDVQVNYFGALATLEGLRPALARSSAPRAAVVTSFALLSNYDEALLKLLEAGDEEAALQCARPLMGLQPMLYATAKRGILRWLRLHAPRPEWAGAGIALNAVAPGLVRTPMIGKALDTEEGRAQLAEMVPMPLNGAAEPEVVARLLIWLTSAENSHVTGQNIFIDGGGEVLKRGPDHI